MAKLTLRDIAGKLKEKLQTGLGVNDGKPFVQSPVGQKINNFNRNVSQAYTKNILQPIANIPRYEIARKPIENKVLSFGRDVALGIPESFVNIPRNLAVGAARLEIEKNKALMERQRPNLRNIASGIAPIAEAGLDFASFGVGSNIAKQGAKQLIKGGIKQAAKKGAISGGLYGATGGLTYGLDRQYGKDFSGKQLLGDVATGAALGGILGGGLAGGGAFFEQVINGVKKLNPKLSQKQAQEIATAYLRDKAGRFAKQAVGYKGVMPDKVPYEPIPLTQVADNKMVPSKYAGLYKNLDKNLNIPENFDIKRLKLGAGVKEVTPETRAKVKAAQAGLYDQSLEPLAQKITSGDMTKADFVKKFNEGLKNQNLTYRQTAENTLKKIQESGLTVESFYDTVAKRFDVIKQAKGNMDALKGLGMDLSHPEMYSKEFKKWQSAKYPTHVKNVAQQPLSVPSTKGVESGLGTSTKRRAFSIPTLTNKEGLGFVSEVESLGRKADLPLLDTYKGYDIVKAGDDISVWDKNKKTLFRVGLDDSKQTGERFVDESNNTIENAKNYIDWLTESKATKGVESMPSVMKTPELPKVDPFEADMIKYNNELSSAAKLPKTEKPFIDTSRQSTDVGDIKSNIGENGGVVDSIKRSFADWVNTRKASQVEGILQGRSFADLKEKGMQGIFEFQSGDKTGRYADVKSYFDTKYGQMQEKGIDFNYKEDYLTQIWDNTSEEVSRVFGRSLSKTPSFTLESLIKNYQEGINAGLKPKYNNIPDLIQSYESATNKAIADHDFFRTLIKENMITTGSKAPRDWVTIDPDRFPRFSVKTDDGTYRGIYKAPPELAKMLNNYLGGAKFEWLAKAADWTSSVKNRVLSFGIPGTAINAHGFNILARNVMASKNPIEGAITGIKYMLNPISAQRQLDATLAKAPEAVKYGLTLSANEFTNILQEPQGFRSKFGDVWNKLFERGLFDRMLPALKLQKFTEVFEGYKKGGMNEYEAGKAAAKFTNDVFGGINIDELGKSRDFENMLRVTILAPDWLKTNLNLAGKIPQSFTTKILDPKMSAYRKFATTMLGSYITANIVNKLTSGHWMYQNDPGNSFNIEAGYTEDGQKRYIRPFGTAADFVRLPSDVFTALKKGDVSVIGRLVRNRLSIPLGVGIGMMTDTDYAGQPIGWRGTDKYGNEMPLKQRIAGVGGEVLTLAGMPSFMKQGIDYASGKTGGEQALLQAFELPVRYSGGAFNKSSQFIKGLGQREGAKGKELYDLIKSVKGVTLSKNQKELLTQNGLKSLPDIMQQKKINSMNTQVQKIKEDIVSGSLTQEEGAVKIQDIVNQIPEVSTNKKGADKSLVSTASASDDLNKPYVFQYTSPSGKISIESVDLSKNIPEPKLTGNKELDKKLISTYKGELTSRATDIRKLYEAGKIDANQAEKLLGELKIKSGSVGGAKKPKKITLKVSSYKAPTINIKKRSKTKIPTIKFKKPKKIKIVRRYTIK